MSSKITSNSQLLNHRPKHVDQPPISSIASRRWKAIGNSISQQSQKVLRPRKQHSKEEEDIERSISDQEFKRVVNELQSSGFKTNIGAIEFLNQEKAHKAIVEEKALSGRPDIKESKAELSFEHQSFRKIVMKKLKTSVFADVNQKAGLFALFDKRQSFRDKVAMDVEESSQKAIYRRSSDCQLKALHRVSMQELEESLCKPECR